MANWGNYVPAVAQGGTFWTNGPVPDSTSPTGIIASPASGSIIEPGTLILSAQASDNSGGVGISHVIFRVYYDGNWHVPSIDPSSPYSAQWQAPASLASQAIRFAIDITDKAGNLRENAGDEVTVHFNGISNLYLPIVINS